MKVICLGGAGRICREAALDLVQFSDFEIITIADFNKTEADNVATWLNDPRVDSVQINVFDEESAIAILKNYDVVVDGTTISLNRQSTKLIAEAGCSGINLNGFGEEYEFDAVFKAKGKLFVPGFGMTPGTTNMMAKHACDKLAKIKSVRVSHGSYRPVAFSKAITETTTYEYDPELPGRVVWENGQFIQVPPFARPRMINLPEPYGPNLQYIIPHAETVTLEEYLRDKGVGLIEVRGTWPQQNMRLVRALFEYGFMRNEKISMGGTEFEIMDAIGEYLQQCPEGKETALYGYSLHIEVIGTDDSGKELCYVLTHTHPASDGSVEGWENLRAYTRNVAIPLSIGAILIGSGKATGTGTLIPEKVFNPQDVFDELAKRQIFIHETVSDQIPV